MRGEECYATQCGEARAVAPMPSRRQAERGMETCLMIGMLSEKRSSMILNGFWKWSDRAVLLRTTDTRAEHPSLFGQSLHSPVN